MRHIPRERYLMLGGNLAGGQMALLFKLVSSGTRKAELAYIYYQTINGCWPTDYLC